MSAAVLDSLDEQIQALRDEREKLSKGLSLPPAPTMPEEMWMSAVATRGGVAVYTAKNSREKSEDDAYGWDNRTPSGDCVGWSKSSGAVRYVRADEVQRLIEAAVSVALAAATRAA